MGKNAWEGFGSWLKRERGKADVSQKMLAEGVPLHMVQISRLENGHSCPKRATVIKIVEAINRLTSKHKADLEEAMLQAGYTDPRDPSFPRQLSDLPFSAFGEAELWKIREMILLELKYLQQKRQLEEAGMPPKERIFQQDIEKLAIAGEKQAAIER